MIQLSILKITGYGPWTLTLGSDREHELQMLQASLYKKVQNLFSKRNSIVFQNRSDELFVVSNRLNLADHITIQQDLRESFDVSFTVSIGCADTPFEANIQAYESIKNNIILDKKYDIFGNVKCESPQVSIMHLDVDSLSCRRISPYEISSMMFELYSKMSKYFITKNSLAFFMGGDNFMVVAGDTPKKSAMEFINNVKNDMNVSLNCGIGHASTSRDAVRLATESLDKIREIRDSGKSKPDVYELSC